MNPASDVVVIGAGISGLASAWWLQSGGHKVTIIEADSRPGGTICTVRDSGYLVEAGPNSTLETSPLIAQLLEQTGTIAQRIYANPTANNRFILRGGMLLPLPLSPPAFFKTRLFSAGAKLGLLREPFVRRSSPGVEETVAQFVRRRLGVEFLDYAINPFVAGGDAGWEVTAAGPRGPLTLHAKTVVLATPTNAAAQLMRTHAPCASDALDAIPYPPVASVASAYARADLAHALDGFGFLVPKKERRQILGTIFSSTLFGNRAPDGMVLLTTFVGGMRQPELAERDEAALASLVQEELESLLGVRAAPQRTWVKRWKRAIPQYTLGHLARIAAVAEAERALPGLYLCANYRGGISVADCIKSSRTVSDRVAQYLGRPDPERR